MLITIHIIIQGNVQGVGYRNYIYQHANELNITGWVRNLNDGSVETVVQGSLKSIEKLLILIKVGPPAGKITKIEKNFITKTQAYSIFSIK